MATGKVGKAVGAGARNGWLAPGPGSSGDSFRAWRSPATRDLAPPEAPRSRGSILPAYDLFNERPSDGDAGPIS